jgi:WD40 repeat protein
MTARAQQRRRRRRLALAGAFTLLLAVLAVVSTLWRKSESSRLEAEREARRAEASKLLALGRLELDEGPTDALAYAIASLELFDTPETRRFALEALWRGPTAFRLVVAEPHGACRPSFSPDGRWFAQDHEPGRIWLYPRDGGAPAVLETVRDPARQLAHFEFGPGSELLVSTYWVLDQDRFDNRLGFWSVPDGREVRAMELEGPTEVTVAGDRVVTATMMDDGSRWLRSWPWGGGMPSTLGRVDSPQWFVDPELRWLGWAKGGDVFLSLLGSDGASLRPIVAHHPESLSQFALDPEGRRLASAGESGRIRLWSLADGEAELLRTLEGSDPVSELVFHPSGSKLAWGEASGLELWDLEGPPDADPLELRTSAVDILAFHPDGRWLYSTDPLEGATFWSLGRRYPRVLRGLKDWPQGLAFAPDGSWLASRSWLGEVRVWPLAPSHQDSRRAFSVEDVGAELRVGREGKVLVTTSGEGVIVVSMDGRPPTRLGGFSPGSIALSLALGPRGRLVAAGTQRAGGPGEIRVWDLQTGEAKTLDPSWVLGEKPLGNDAIEGTVSGLALTPKGRLISAGGGGVISWNLEGGGGEVLLEQEGEFPTLTMDAEGRHLVVAESDSANAASPRSALTLVDLEQGTARPVTSHGDRVSERALAFDPTGKILVTGDRDGIVRVGSVTGAEPHLLLGHKGRVESVAVSPDGQWVASSGEDGTVRLWPMPDLSERPLHTLAYDALLAKLKSLTNLRVVKSPETATGWELEVGPFPGWEEAPSW